MAKQVCHQDRWETALEGEAFPAWDRGRGRDSRGSSTDEHEGVEEEEGEEKGNA
jgi:hypothetical protein